MKAILPDYEKGNEDLLHRLGVALVDQWDNVPDKLKATLLERAQLLTSEVTAASPRVQLREALELFVETHRGWPAKAVPTVTA